ncbi:hypothetical protein [Helicobacter typhlonius]|uniref:hypothetical protein n=1 Tax=Helicobacter typhlonius TaxID=76936 RepID=UPI002FE31E70
MKKINRLFVLLILSFYISNAGEQERFLDSYRKATELGWLGLSHCMGIDDKSEIEKELYHLSLIT